VLLLRVLLLCVLLLRVLLRRVRLLCLLLLACLLLRHHLLLRHRLRLRPRLLLRHRWLWGGGWRLSFLRSLLPVIRRLDPHKGQKCFVASLLSFARGDCGDCGLGLEVACMGLHCSCRTLGHRCNGVKSGCLCCRRLLCCRLRRRLRSCRVRCRRLLQLCRGCRPHPLHHLGWVVHVDVAPRLVSAGALPSFICLHVGIDVWGIGGGGEDVSRGRTTAPLAVLLHDRTGFLSAACY
jgi:hypothetical protein